MPRAAEPPPPPYDYFPQRKRWTRQECDWLRENDALPSRYELIDGEIITKVGQKPPHAYAIVMGRSRLTARFGQLFGFDQAPIWFVGTDGFNEVRGSPAALAAGMDSASSFR